MPIWYINFEIKMIFCQSEYSDSIEFMYELIRSESREVKYNLFF